MLLMQKRVVSRKRVDCLYKSFAREPGWRFTARLQVFGIQNWSLGILEKPVIGRFVRAGLHTMNSKPPIPNPEFLKSPTLTINS